MENGDDFYVTLVSDESEEYFNSNTIKSEFTNKLPFPLNLTGQYKVALCEIYIPPFYLASDIIRGNKLERRRREIDEDLEIFLKFKEWKIQISNPLLAQLKNKTFQIPNMLQFLINNIDYRGDDYFFQSDVLFEALVNGLIQSLNDLELNDPQIEFNAYNPRDCIYVRFPISIENENTPSEKFVTKVVGIRPTQYSSFQEFLRQLYQQLPKKDRNIQVLVKSILRSKSDIELDRTKLFRKQLMSSITTRANGVTEKQIEIVFPGQALSRAPLAQDTHNQNENEKDKDMINESHDLNFTVESAPEAERTVESAKASTSADDTLSSSLQPMNVNSVSTNIEREKESEQADRNVNELPDYDIQLSYPYPVKRKKNEKKILNNTHMLFIYSDIVDFSIYTNRLFKILRIVPFFPIRVEKGVHKIYTAPEYYPVSRNFIDSIGIKINNRGESLRFETDDIPIYLKLHFKKV